MSVVIRGVRRYGEGKRVDVLVDDGQIADIGARLQIPEDADVIDATGQILLPVLSTCTPTCVNRPRIRRRHRNRLGRRCFGRIHRGVRDGQHQPRGRQPSGHRPRLAARPAGGFGRRSPGRRGHNGTGGKELTEMGMMAAGAAQVRMFSDDGNCVADPLVMRRALEYATGLGVLIAQHAEEPRLTVGSVAHEGPTPRGLALPGGRGGRGVDRRP
ncbi:amidohydrolase family protein [Mycobacterium xenopi 4042]|uniref:Amidohydrolase family protein n=1 Tax=Mycobacterium xenopi 4042 TaxID=1299334 RepID=X7YQJ6_MYCXE|nr:amidohydrolase family protein [Mycobacterium xenopi 4042]